MPCGCWKSNLGPVKAQRVVLTAQLSLQPLQNFLKNITKPPCRRAYAKLRSVWRKNVFPPSSRPFVGGPASGPHPLRAEAPPTATQRPPPSSLLPDSLRAGPDAPLRKMAADSEVSSAPWVPLSQSSAADVSGPRLTVCALLCPRSPSPKCLRSQTSPQPRSGRGE